MNILYVFDSFKNSLHTDELGKLAVKISSEIDKTNNYSYLPISDGGEGSLKIVECFLKGKKIELESVSADGFPLKTHYIIKDKTAFIEVAMTSGMETLKNGKRSILKRSTYGTGIVLKDAIDRKIKEIVLFVGGTSTCDGGIGIIKALSNAKRDDYLLHRIKMPRFFRYKDIKMTIAVDVATPLLGSKGSAYVFAAQKGASKREIKILESKMQELRDLVFLTSGKDINFIGAGAGGGIPALLSVYFDINIVSGFDYIATLIKLYKKMGQSDIIITGEGKFDKQSFMGKTVGKILQRAKDLKKDILIICGTSSIDVSNFPIFQLSSYKGFIFDKNESIKAFSNIIKSIILVNTLWKRNS